MFFQSCLFCECGYLPELTYIVSTNIRTFYFFAFFPFWGFGALFLEYFASRSDRKLLKFCSLDCCRCCREGNKKKAKLVRG